MSDALTPATLGLAALAIGLCGGLTAVARVIARRVGMLDRPDDKRKLHGEPIPLLGGAALYLSVLASIGIAFAGDQSWIVASGVTQRLVGLLLLSAGLFCGIGLWDDRRSMRPRTKLLLQIAASLPFVLWGRSIDLIHLLGMEFELGMLGLPFTVFWLVACANVFNLMDGLDGLAGSMALIVCAAITVHSAMQGYVGAMVVSLILSGSLIGFLPHNWPPAKIFLGDCGSLMLGFLIGALSIESSMKTTTGFALAIPLVLLSVPAFDTAMAIVRRKLTGRGIGEGDREHIHHRLLQRGLTRTQSLLAISGISLAMAVVTFVSASVQSDWLALGVCLVLLLLLILGRVFGDHETLLVFRAVHSASLWLAEKVPGSLKAGGYDPGPGLTEAGSKTTRPTDQQSPDDEPEPSFGIIRPPHRSPASGSPAADEASEPSDGPIEERRVA